MCLHLLYTLLRTVRVETRELANKEAVDSSHHSVKYNYKQKTTDFIVAKLSLPQILQSNRKREPDVTCCKDDTSCSKEEGEGEAQYLLFGV